MDISSALEDNRIIFKEIKGSVETRQKSINSFKNGNVQVIFLNSRYYGAGINLEETTDIIIYHSMSESSQSQIIGRANRIGRETSLKVHHLL